MRLRNLNIAPRAALGFSALALLVVLLGSFALVKMSQMQAAFAVVEENSLPSILAVSEISDNYLRLRTATSRLMQPVDAASKERDYARVEELKRGMAKGKSEYTALISDAEEQTLYDDFAHAGSLYLAEHDKLINFVRKNDFASALSIATGRMKEYDDAMDEALAKMTYLNQADAGAAGQRLHQAEATARAGVVVAMILALSITVVLAMLLTRSIVMPINEALSVAETVAAGDLSQRISVKGRDEPARLLLAMQGMQQNLRSTVQGIAESSSQLASASEELSAVTEDATRGLHQQSNEIEQAATAVNEMTAAVDEVARNAVATSEASRESDLTARYGREQVIKTVNAIGQLAQDVTTTSTEVEHLAGKVRDISQVLDVIRSIAEQTNLLALNAAIEAARAGEAGRGFAVVADEVRALAHRTQQSTQEIEQMVIGVQQSTDNAVNAMQSSNDRAQESLEVARAAGTALDEITLVIGHISERNMVIASASEEQAQVAREVDRNLVNIRGLALQSSAGANQTSAASLELSRLAVDLNTMVARFKI